MKNLIVLVVLACIGCGEITSDGVNASLTACKDYGGLRWTEPMLASEVTFRARCKNGVIVEGRITKVLGVEK